MTEEVSIDLEEIIEREKNSNKSKDGRKKLYILSTLVIVVISGIVVTLLTNLYFDFRFRPREKAERICAPL